MQALIKFAFCLVLFFLWIILDRLRVKSSRLKLKGWTELLLGIFFLFVGSIVDVTENIPYLSKFLTLGQTDFSTILKTGLYILGIILVLISPFNWLSVLLERKTKDEDEERTERFLRSLIIELKGKTTLPDLFNLAFPEITGFLKAQKGAAFLISEEELILAASCGFSKESVEAMKRFKMEDDIISWCAKNKSSRIMNSFSQSEKRLTELICDEKAVSLICSSLLSRRENMGVLAIFNDTEFTKDDLLTLSSLGEKIGEMIRSIDYEREIKSKSEKIDSLIEQKESMAELCESVLISKADEILNRVVKIGKKMLHSNSCSVFEIDSENKEAIIMASSESGLLGKSMEISESSEIKEAVERKEIVFKTLEATDEGIKAVLIFPLFIQDQVLGVLLFEFREYSPASTEVELDLAKSLACLTSFVLFHQNLSRSIEKEKELTPSFKFLEELKSGLCTISERIQSLVNNIQKGETDTYLVSNELKKIQLLTSELSEFMGIEIQAYPQVKGDVLNGKMEEEGTKKMRILVIDDQQVIRDLLKEISRSLGYQIELVSDSEEGLKTFKKDNFDLVITELDMPQVSGWEISKEVKRLKPNVLVILLTEWIIPTKKRMLEEYGVDYILNKPFNLDKLRLIFKIADGLRM